MQENHRIPTTAREQGAIGAAARVGIWRMASIPRDKQSSSKPTRETG